MHNSTLHGNTIYYNIIHEPCLCILQVLAQSSAMLLNLDRSFKIELSWLASGAYEAVAGAVDSKILASFPNKAAAVTMAQAKARLSTIKEDLLYKVASRQSQSAVDSMISVLSKMASGMPPPESIKTAGGVFTKCWQLMPHFIRHQAGSETFTGGEAIKMRFAELQKLLKKDKRPAQLHELELYKASATPHATKPKCNMLC